MYQLILPVDFLLKHCDDKVFGRQHVLQIPRHGIETIVRILLRLFLEDRHAALITSIGSFTLILFMFHDVDPHDKFVTVDAGDFNKFLPQRGAEKYPKFLYVQ